MRHIWQNTSQSFSHSKTAKLSQQRTDRFSAVSETVVSLSFMLGLSDGEMNWLHARLQLTRDVCQNHEAGSVCFTRGSCERWRYVTVCKWNIIVFNIDDSFVLYGCLTVLYWQKRWTFAQILSDTKLKWLSYWIIAWSYEDKFESLPSWYRSFWQWI